MPKIEWIGGYPRIIKETVPPKAYILFMVEDEVFSTEDMPLDVAEAMAKSIGGLVMPAGMRFGKGAETPPGET